MCYSSVAASQRSARLAAPLTQRRCCRLIRFLAAASLIPLALLTRVHHLHLAALDGRCARLPLCPLRLDLATQLVGRVLVAVAAAAAATTPPACR